MTSHCIRRRRTDLAVDWDWMAVSYIEHLPQVYDISFLKITIKCPWPFPVYPGSSHTWMLRWLI